MMQLDTAVMDSLELPPSLSLIHESNMKPQRSSSGSNAICSEETLLGDHKDDFFFFGSILGFHCSFPDVRVQFVVVAKQRGGD